MSGSTNKSTNEAEKQNVQDSSAQDRITDVYICIFFDGTANNMYEQVNKGNHLTIIRKRALEEDPIKIQYTIKQGLFLTSEKSDEDKEYEKRMYGMNDYEEQRIQAEKNYKIKNNRGSNKSTNVYENGGLKYSNIAILRSLTKRYNRNNGKKQHEDNKIGINYNLYIEGSGAKWDKGSDIIGLGMGTGRTGVVGLVSKAVVFVGNFLHSNISGHENEVNIHFAIFGFSRGSTCGRLFSYLAARGKNGGNIIREQEFAQYMPQNEAYYNNGRVCLFDSYPKTTVDFLGIFDTVSSIGFLAKNDNDANYGINRLVPHKINGETWYINLMHGQKLGDFFHQNAVNQFGSSVSQAINNKGQSLENEINNVGTIIQKTYEDSTAALSSTINYVGDSVGALISDTSEIGGNLIGKTAITVGKDLDGIGTQMGESMKFSGQVVGNIANQSSSAIGTIVADGASDTSRLVKSVGEAVNDTVTQAGSFIGRCVSDMGNPEIGQSAEQIGQLLGNNVSQLSSSIENNVNADASDINNLMMAGGQAAEKLISQEFTSAGNYIDNIASHAGQSIGVLGIQLENSIVQAGSETGNLVKKSGEAIAEVSGMTGKQLGLYAKKAISVIAATAPKTITAFADGVQKTGQLAGAVVNSPGATIGALIAKKVFGDAQWNFHRMNVAEYGLYSPYELEKIKHTFHICAMDEFRENFALVDLGKNLKNNCTEVFMPGCHSDIGGGFMNDDFITKHTLRTTIGNKPTTMVTNPDPRKFNDSGSVENTSHNTDTLLEEGLMNNGWLYDTEGKDLTLNSEIASRALGGFVNGITKVGLQGVSYIAGYVDSSFNTIPPIGMISPPDHEQINGLVEGYKVAKDSIDTAKKTSDALVSSIQSSKNGKDVYYRKEKDKIEFSRFVQEGYSNITLQMMYERALSPTVGLRKQGWPKEFLPFGEHATDKNCEECLPERFRLTGELSYYKNRLMDKYKPIKNNENKRVFLIPDNSVYKELRHNYLHFSCTDELNPEQLKDNWYNLNEEKRSAVGANFGNTPNWYKRNNDYLLCRIIYRGDNSDNNLHYMNEYLS